MFNKKAQIGETVTWVVATIIIIVILTVSIFIVSSTTFSNSKKLELKNIHTDLLVTKSLLGYLLTENNFNELKKKELPLVTDSISKSNDELVKKIFIGLYEQDYSGNIWLGAVRKECVWGRACVINERTLTKGISASCLNIFYDRIKLDSDSIVELLVGCKK